MKRVFILFTSLIVSPSAHEQPPAEHISSDFDICDLDRLYDAEEGYSDSLPRDVL